MRSATPRATSSRNPSRWSGSSLKLISQRSVYSHVDVEACTDHDVLLCPNMYAGVPVNMINPEAVDR
jgi:hypothetical protein